MSEPSGELTFFTKDAKGKRWDVSASYLKNTLLKLGKLTELEVRLERCEAHLRRHIIVRHLKIEGRPLSLTSFKNWITGFKCSDLLELRADGIVTQFKSGTHTMIRLEATKT